MRYEKKSDKKVKKITFILAMISLTICLSIIKTTYAKYLTSASGDASIQIARWKILVNNLDIQKNNELSSVIKPVFEGNENIASNVIAPTAEGYFDIIIDATNTDVSFDYEITTKKNETSSVSDLILSAYSIDDGTKQNITNKDGQLKLTNSIKYNQEKKTIKLRIYLKWNDDETNGATMNNSSDTTATEIDTNQAKTTINVKFIQVPKETRQA